MIIRLIQNAVFVIAFTAIVIYWVLDKRYMRRTPEEEVKQLQELYITPIPGLRP